MARYETWWQQVPLLVELARTCRCSICAERREQLHAQGTAVR